MPVTTCQTPDLHPRKPTITVPPGACDTHAHLFGPTNRYPHQSKPAYAPPDVDVDDYRHVLATLGIEHAVIVHSAVNRDHQVTIDALRESAGRWRGIATIDHTISEHGLLNLHEAGFCGVRFNPYNNTDAGLRGLEEVTARIKPLGWHIQLHLDARDLVELESRLLRLEVPIVIDHLGHMPIKAGINNPGFQILLEMLRKKQCWVKLSAPMRFGDLRPPYPATIPFVQSLIAAGPDRVVWGSDWPHVIFDGYMPNDGELLDLLALWAPDPALRKRILVDNPAALYGFKQA